MAPVSQRFCSHCLVPGDDTKAAAEQFTIHGHTQSTKQADGTQSTKRIKHHFNKIHLFGWPELEIKVLKSKTKRISDWQPVMSAPCQLQREFMWLPLKRNNSLSDTAVRHCRQPICRGLRGTSQVVKATEPFDLVPPDTPGGTITQGHAACHVCLIA